ncbi:MAG: NeuD/PglB/VioB family sugar acetyltransferase [Bacteroidetes bacterium]|nr:NeuD/PglB/VioB family sugar acetyltransferase [Bacteroidota bacterium]
MIILGAGGHAREIIGVLSELEELENLCLYDDVTPHPQATLYDRFPILATKAAAAEALAKDPRFLLGVGKPALRKKLSDDFKSRGGRLTSVISPFARIGRFNVSLGDGLNIMTGAVLTSDIVIGEGTLIHINVTVHHDCIIGDYCELSPGCHILGKAEIGHLTSIGSGAVVLPGVKVGSRVIVGAGAVVTSNIPDGVTVKGVPAKI